MVDDLDIKQKVAWFNRRTPISDDTESSDFVKLGNIGLYLEETERKSRRHCNWFLLNNSIQKKGFSKIHSKCCEGNWSLSL